MSSDSLFDDDFSGPNFNEFKSQVEILGQNIVATEKPNNHWQIKVGKVTVNYYPYSQQRTVYVNSIPNVIKAIREHDVDYKKCLSMVQGLYNRFN